MRSAIVRRGGWEGEEELVTKPRHKPEWFGAKPTAASLFTFADAPRAASGCSAVDVIMDDLADDPELLAQIRNEVDDQFDFALMLWRISDFHTTLQ